MASASGIARSIDVKNVGVKIKVPNNDIAYVMYYLKCVLKGCGLDIIQDDLLDFENYNSLSQKRQDQVFLAAYTYSPDELLNKTIFPDEDGSVCGSQQNVFLEISEDLTLFHAQSEVLIVGERKRAASIMVFREHWMDKFYVEPMKRNVHRLRRAMIATISSHCEHCKGQSGKCVCDKCPRTAESKCSRTLAISGHGLMGALSKALEEVAAEATKAEAPNRHCQHCKGFDATCGCEEGCPKPAKSQCVTVHKNVKCDVCTKQSFVGTRYKCAQCDNYDLCENCYKKNEHALTHGFHLIERMGSKWKLLEPRLKPKAILDSEGSGFFYETMSIWEMKEYLKDNDVPCNDVFEKEDLRRKVWECYCDSISAKELAQVIADIGLDASSCRDIRSRRNMVKAAFQVPERPAPPTPSSSSRNEFNVDQRVILSGLKTANLNGMKGRIVKLDEVPGRVDVFFESNGRTLRVKYENLIPDVELVD